MHPYIPVTFPDAGEGGKGLKARAAIHLPRTRFPFPGSMQLSPEDEVVAPLTLAAAGWMVACGCFAAGCACHAVAARLWAAGGRPPPSPPPPPSDDRYDEAFSNMERGRGAPPSDSPDDDDSPPPAFDPDHVAATTAALRAEADARRRRTSSLLDAVRQAISLQDQPRSITSVAPMDPTLSPVQHMVRSHLQRQRDEHHRKNR